MASLSSTSALQGTSKPVKKLAELLEERQEPFVLEIYLLERGLKPNKFLKRSTKFDGGPKSLSGQFSSIAKTVYSKLVFIDQVIKFKNSGSKHKRRKDNDKEPGGVGVESDRLSSDSCSTDLCNTCSEQESVSSSTENASHQVAPDRALTQWRILEDNKQCSPVSVLDEIDFLQAIPVYNVRQEETTPSMSRIKHDQKVSEDSVLSASLWELLVESRREKTKHPGREPYFPQYMQSKRALQQTRQLLFDCVREVVENHNGLQQKMIMKRNKQKGMMGADEIGKIICSNLKSWGKLSDHEPNIKRVLTMDFSWLGEDKWGCFEEYRREIAMEIGDGILDNIVDEIVRDMGD